MQFHKKMYKRIFLVFSAAIVFATSASAPLLALDTTFYKQNNILYTGDGDSTSTCSAIQTFTGTLPAESVAKLEAANIKSLAESNMARYTHAESQTGVPWQIAAAIHFREANMNPDSSMADGSSLSAGVSKDGLPINSDPNVDAANMMNHLLNNASGIYGLDKGALSSWNAQSWGEALLAYNRGGMYKTANASYDTSPYVMNYIDDQHMNMAWQRADSYNGSKRLNGLFDGGQKDSRPGALTVASYLGMNLSGTTGGTSGSSNCSGPGAVSGDIVATAQNLSWPDRSHALSDPKPEYVEAMKAVDLYRGNACGPAGADCGVFVATVMRSSGADTEFPVGTSNILTYLRNNGDYTKVEAKDTSGLVPGDIFIIAGHTFLYAGDDATDGGKNMASASCKERTGDRGYDVYFSDRRGAYEIYRKK